jgi:hypothetical protein
VGFAELNLGDAILKADRRVGALSIGLAVCWFTICKRVEGYMRNKWGRIALALLLGLTMISSGCSTNWVQQGQEIIAVLMPAAANLVILVVTLQGKEVSAEDLALVQKAGSEVGADLTLVQGLIGAYESADQKAKQRILSQIQSALQAAQENLQGLVVGLHIKDESTRVKVTAIVGILLAEMQGVAAILPVVKGQGAEVKAQGAEVKAQGAGARGQGAAARRKKPMSAGEFSHSYNAIITAKTGRAELDDVSDGLKLQEKR